MKTFRFAVPTILYIACCGIALAQSPVVPISSDPDPITMTAIGCIRNGIQTLLPTGIAQFQIVDGNGYPTSIASGTGQQITTSVASEPVTAGTFAPVQIPNPANTSLSPYLLRLSIVDSIANKVTTYPKLQIMLNDVPVAGRFTQFNFCLANTSLGLANAPVVVVTGPPGPQGEQGATGPPGPAGSNGTVGTTAVGPANAIQTTDGAGNLTGSGNATVDPSGNASVKSLTLTGPGPALWTIPPSFFAAFPSCNSANEGARGSVKDSAVSTPQAIVVGSGTYHLPVYCDGTNWIVD